MKHFLTGLVALFLSASLAFAQSPVVTRPYGSISNNQSGTIAVTNTFQSIYAANTTTTGRVGCTIINYGTNTMWVFFGPIASATKAKSVQLTAGQGVYCQWGVTVLQDQVSITGTATEAFFANAL